MSAPAAPLTRADAQRALDAKTKPLGALGRLERLAARLAVASRRSRRARAGARGGVRRRPRRGRRGVSAYPSAVTAEMTRNFARAARRCACSRARRRRAGGGGRGRGRRLGALPGVVPARVRRASRNLLREPAMTPAECDAALAAGASAARRAADAGADVLVLGEMGIGNTTSAAALVTALTGAPPALTVGRGTGVDDARLAHKRAVVEGALDRHRAAPAPLRGDEARRALEGLGGLELAAMAGAAAEGAARGLVVVVDGYIATAAALAAAAVAAGGGGAPRLADALVFAHRSAEPGHAAALDGFVALGMDRDDVRPLLDLGLRLGEGTGGVLALPLLRAAARVLAEMATFGGAGVSTAGGA
jgi:nicotinate-nucleotide--dimethylbenzimidazole phosphoribosyltransferase